MRGRFSWEHGEKTRQESLVEFGGKVNHDQSHAYAGTHQNAILSIYDKCNQELTHTYHHTLAKNPMLFLHLLRELLIFRVRDLTRWCKIIDVVRWKTFQRPVQGRP
jgi:hypothetical protein